MATKPVFAITAGAFHRIEAYQLLVDELKTRGFEARVEALKTTGSNADAHVIDDVEHLRASLLLPLLEEKREVILLAHSFGAVPAGPAAKGLTLQDRKSQGLQGGIIGVILLAAFSIPGIPSPPLVDGVLDGTLSSWARLDASTKLVHCDTPKEVFYNEVKDEGLLKRLIDNLTTHSNAAFASKVPETVLSDSYLDGRRAYIRCLKDNSIPVEFQDFMVDYSKLQWIVKTMDSDHSPFVSRPDELADTVVELASGWKTN